MTIKYADLVAKTQDQIDSDVDFQNSLADLSDDEKSQAVSDKQQELLDEEVSALDAKANKAEEIANNQKIRAEKAEALAKGSKTEKETPKNVNRSLKETVKDAKAIQDLDNDEDIDEVMDYAERKGITLTEARKSPFIQSFLQTTKEQRKTAEATSTASNRKSNNSSSAASLLQRATKGELKDDEMKAGAKAMLEDIFGKK